MADDAKKGRIAGFNYSESDLVKKLDNYRAGVELPVLEAIVGHVDRETTRIYTHLHAGDLVDAVQVMDGKKNAVSNKSVTRKNA